MAPNLGPAPPESSLPKLLRINVVGSSGSGKSTLARQLAAMLEAPFVELDALYWKPNWTESTDEELFPVLETALSGDRWVLDGNYNGKTVHIKWRRVQLVVWLDLPYWQILYQVIVRTIRRSVTQEELWSGNRESLAKAFFHRDSIIWWSLTHLRENRRRYSAAMKDPQYSHIRFLRLRSRGEVIQFLAKAADQSAESGSID